MVSSLKVTQKALDYGGQVSFVLSNGWEQGMMLKKNQIRIICPACENYICKANKRDNDEHITICNKCYKMVRYNPYEGYVELWKVPKEKKSDRKASSGVTFR